LFQNVLRYSSGELCDAPPDKVVIDKCGANFTGLPNMNYRLVLNGWFWLIEILQINYQNNIIDQDHRFIKELTQQMKGFKPFNSAAVTLEGFTPSCTVSRSKKTL
jgi:putative transposase